MFRKRSDTTNTERRRQPDVRGGAIRAQSYSYYTAHRNDPSAQGNATPSSSRLRSTAEPPKQRWYAKKSVRFWAVLVIGAIILVELTFLSSNGTVTVINSSGNLDGGVDTAAYEATFDGLLASNVLNHNKLTIDANGITTEMQRAHPELESVTVITPLIGIRPSVYVRVSEPVFVLKQDASSYLLSAAGYIIAKKAVDSLPVVIDETGESVQVAKQLLPSAHVTFMHTVWYQLTEQGIKVDALVLPQGKAFEVDVRLKDQPYYLKFNTTEDATRQSGAAVAVIQQLGSVTPKEYIDVRVPGRAYYR